VDHGGWSVYNNDVDLVPKLFTGIQLHLVLQRVTGTKKELVLYSTHVEPSCEILVEEELSGIVIAAGRISNPNHDQIPNRWAMDFIDWLAFKPTHNGPFSGEKTFWDAYILSMRDGGAEKPSITEQQLEKAVLAVEAGISSSPSPPSPPSTTVPFWLEFLDFAAPQSERREEDWKFEVQPELEIWDAKVNCHTFAQFLLKTLSIQFPPQVVLSTEDYPAILVETLIAIRSTATL
jgi:hypothetical protein